MCGFAGFVTNRLDVNLGLRILNDMGRSLYHRGPDHVEVFHEPEYGIGMVHTRLSILDLSNAGSQPMLSHNGRYVVSYNGEIYNYKELKAELTALHIVFNSGSDTEVLVEYIAQFGLSETLSKIRGMFAFSLFDFNTSSLSLVRDRAGEKPLYYSCKDGQIVFGSELKPLMKWTGFDKTLDKKALTQFILHGFISSGHSIFKDVTKQRPGTIIEFKLSSQGWTKAQESTYWNCLPVGGKFTVKNRQKCIDDLDDLLSSAVQEQLVADVPVGAFLSGGIDSSLIVSMMNRASSSKINTFSIGFEDKEYNEAEHAKAVADHIGTSHETLYVDDKSIMEVIPQLPKIYDEPMADMSQLPTYLVSQLARKQVTVALTGDAGDEIFGGYNRYLWTEKMTKVNNYVPVPVRTFISRLLLTLSPAAYDIVGRLIPQKYRPSEIGLKSHKALRSFSAHDNVTMYELILNQFSALGMTESSSGFSRVPADQVNAFKILSPSDQFMILDFMNYMTDGVLCKVDRAAMANSLETRVPFLDKRVIEFGMSLPSELKIYNGQSKWILRKVLEKYIPKELFDRPKMGFAVPMGKWLRGPLKDWSFAMLEKHKYRLEGVIDVKMLDDIWSQHQKGKHNFQTQIWSVLTFFNWCEEYLD